jgi:hypothetical protein
MSAIACRAQLWSGIDQGVDRQILAPLTSRLLEREVD